MPYSQSLAISFNAQNEHHTTNNLFISSMCLDYIGLMTEAEIKLQPSACYLQILGLYFTLCAPLVVIVSDQLGLWHLVICVWQFCMQFLVLIEFCAVLDYFFLHFYDYFAECKIGVTWASEFTRLVDRSVTPWVVNFCLYFRWPMHNLTWRRKMSSNGSANVKHSEAMSDEIITTMSTACGASIFLFELF